MVRIIIIDRERDIGRMVRNTLKTGDDIREDHSALGLALAAWAQDYNAAMEAYNAAAQAENKAEQLAGFRSAMEQFAACEDEDAPAQVAKCQNNIVTVLFSIVTDDLKDKNYDQALVSLDAAVGSFSDFEFINTLDYPIRIWAQPQNGVVTVLIYRAEEE